MQRRWASPIGLSRRMSVLNKRIATTEYLQWVLEDSATPRTMEVCQCTFSCRRRAEFRDKYRFVSSCIHYLGAAKALCHTLGHQRSIRLGELDGTLEGVEDARNCGVVNVVKDRLHEAIKTYDEVDQL
jgi:hypothetical protein